MPDAVKVGFVPFSTASRGTLVVFCDEALKFGRAAGKALGSSAGLVKRAAAANQFKGKSATTLDILAPEGLKANRLIVVGAGKTTALKSGDFLKLGGVTSTVPFSPQPNHGRGGWSSTSLRLFSHPS